MTLHGKTALVTGSTSGIGLEIATTFAGAGANLVINGFGDAGEIEEERRSLERDHRVKVAYSAADLSRPDRIAEMIEEAVRTFGRIDILVNNAGIQHVEPIETFPPETWDRIIAIDLTAAFHTIRLALPGMREAGWGRIVNMASAHSLVASPDKSAYVTAKHGLAGLTKTVALETAGAGITCNCISPGYVWTPLVERQIPETMKARGMTEEEVTRDVMPMEVVMNAPMPVPTSVIAQHALRATGTMPRIEDYALIGGGRTAALVSRTGSIDWLCWPRLDAPACLAALLGDDSNGFWSLAPAEPARTARAYEPNSTILRTDHACAGGHVRVTDFMPLRDGRDAVIRRVEGLSGAVEMRCALALRPDYGRTVPWVSRLPRKPEGPHRWSAVAGPSLFVLTAPVELHGVDLRTEGTFRIRAGETLDFELSHGASHKPPPPEIDAHAELEACRDAWAAFAAQGRPMPGLRPEWQAAMDRSAVTLKALTYAPTGGIAAAATTSLPEHIGGARNWDYRYCWLRDAAFTLDAFLVCGHRDEATAWRDWLMRAVAGAPEQLQIMYGLAGERILTEWEVPWLVGHAGSAPVRVGNAAAEQFQLDVYGEVADALFEARAHGLPPHPQTDALRPRILRCLRDLWRAPDEGIWEIRGPRRHYTHSKVMAWVAFDRAARRGGAGEAEGWRALADEVRAEVMDRAFDEDANTFVQSYGASEIDASLLLLPLYGFVPADDPRMIGTVAAIKHRLGRDGLLLRYEGDDGLAPGEGAFLLCSFWMVEVLVLQGEVEQATTLFERLLSLRNDVGLLAEEYDTRADRQLGNFPQAFSHVGIVNAAAALSHAGS